MKLHQNHALGIMMMAGAGMIACLAAILDIVRETNHHAFYDWLQALAMVMTIVFFGAGLGTFFTDPDKKTEGS